MANIAATAVTVNRAFKAPGSTYSVRELTLVLAAMGTATNKIQASTLNFAIIKRCSAAVKSDNTVIVPCTPSTDGSLLLFGGGASNAPADYTGTFNITVEGFPS